MVESVLIAPKFLVPVQPAGVVLTEHAVVFEGKQISQVGPLSDTIERWPAAERVDLPDHVLLPGFVNMHTHSAMTILRGYADDLELHSWLNNHIWPAEARFVSPGFVEAGSMIAIAEMIHGGTTCFNDFYFYPDITAEVVCKAGIRACIGMPLFEEKTPWARNIAQCFELGQEVFDRFKNNEQIKLAWAPHAPYSVGDPGLGQMASHSGKNDVAVHIHCLETSYDIEHSKRVYGITPLQRLDALGLLNNRLIAVHMTRLNQAEVELLAEREINVVHCPQSNLKLASGICPVADLLDHGVNVCIGTDGAASNNNLDILEETRTASLLAKGVSGDPEVLKSMQALEMMTINGARALGLEDSIGSIEVGKQADFCAFDLSRVNTQPIYDVISQIVYAASSDQCSDSWSGGRRLKKDGHLTTIDEDKVLGMARDWGTAVGSERIEEGSTA